jgi:hypothetical protein
MRQGQPLRSTYKIPLKISRRSISCGRLPSLAAGIKGSRIAHSGSVTYAHDAPPQVVLVWLNSLPPFFHRLLFVFLYTLLEAVYKGVRSPMRGNRADEGA